jgi:hypothetical protein
VVGDCDEQDALRLRTQFIDGVKQVFRVHAESVLPRCRPKKIKTLLGVTPPTGYPPFWEKGPTAGYAYESAQTMGGPAQLIVGSALKVGNRQVRSELGHGWQR